MQNLKHKKSGQYTAFFFSEHLGMKTKQYKRQSKQHKFKKSPRAKKLFPSWTSNRCIRSGQQSSKNSCKNNFHPTLQIDYVNLVTENFLTFFENNSQFQHSQKVLVLDKIVLKVFRFFAFFEDIQSFRDQLNCFPQNLTFFKRFVFLKFPKLVDVLFYT